MKMVHAYVAPKESMYVEEEKEKEKEEVEVEEEMAANEPIAEETVQEHREVAHTSTEGPNVAHIKEENELSLESLCDAFMEEQIHDLFDISVTDDRSMR